MMQTKYGETVQVFCAYTDLVDINKIKPNPRNPNQHPESQIELLGKVILKQGWRSPITISQRSGMVVKGHGRLEAARYIGCIQCPVDYQKYATEEDEIADLLADNKIAELSHINEELELSAKCFLDSGGFDLELAGFEQCESFGDDDDCGYNPPVVTGKDVLDGQNYTNIQSSRYSINLFGIGGFLPREKGDVIKNKLEHAGAVAGADNSEIIESFFDEILSIQ